MPLHVGSELAQRLPVGGKCDVLRGARQREESCLDRVVAWRERAVRLLGDIEHQDRAHARVVESCVDAEQFAEPGSQAGLLE